MTTFYAHYDTDTGKLLAVGGHKLPDDFPHAGIAEIPEETALKLLNGQYNISDWGYGLKYDADDQMGFHSNISTFIPSNMGEIVEIKEDLLAHALGLDIEFWVNAGVIVFSVPDKLRNKKPLHFLEYPTLEFTLVKKDDPRVIYAELTVPTDALFNTGRYEIQHDFDNFDFKVLTKRVFNFARMIPMLGARLSSNASEGRINKLALYQRNEVPKGIQATLDGDTLTIENIGGCVLKWPFASDDYLLFFTRRYDPTILYDSLTFSITELLNKKKVTLTLPLDMPEKFDLAGYPLASEMGFVGGVR